MTFRNQGQTTFFGALLALLVIGNACGQPYPTKPIRIIVPVAAGGV